MRDALAEQLLSEVMGWNAEDVADERPDLQAMASYKYDQYQQFSPGMRFIESLALWLDQFDCGDRNKAYRFMKERLVFYSEEEIGHLVDAAFPDYIRPLLIERAARRMSLEPWRAAKVVESRKYRRLRRQCLFLGLSDGARLARFRRSNPQLSHEQIWQTYEIPERRAEDMMSELREAITRMSEDEDAVSGARFDTVVLLDDFTASGFSYLRKSDGQFGGKVGRFFRDVDRESPISEFLSEEQLSVFVLIYIATEQALERIREYCGRIQTNLDRNFDWEVEAIHTLGEDIIIPRDQDDGGQIHELIESHYDPDAHDRHTRKGGTEDMKYGFSDCGLPVVLNHNTPNNSLYLLWAYDEHDVRGLFPRVSRHG